MSGNRNRQKPPTAPWPAVLRPTRGIMDLLSLSFEVLGRCWPIIPLLIATHLAEIVFRAWLKQLSGEFRALVACVGAAIVLIAIGFQSQVIQHLIFQAANEKQRRPRLSGAFAFGARTVLRGALMVLIGTAPACFALACLVLGWLLVGGASALCDVLITAAMVIQVPWLVLALFAPTIVAAEPCSPWQAFRESRLLVYQIWTSLLLFVVAWFVVVFLIALVVSGDGQPRAAYAPTSQAAFALTLVLKGLFGGYSIVLAAVYYMSLRRGRSNPPRG